MAKTLIAILLVHVILLVNELLLVNGTEDRQVDVNFVIDRSFSLLEKDSTCLNSFGKPCWDVVADYVVNFTLGFYKESGNRFGPDGLRFGVTTYSCREVQHIPIATNITEGKLVGRDDSTLDLIAAVVYVLRDLHSPYGGTCPSKALGFARYIIEKRRIRFPEREIVLVLITDGFINPKDIHDTQTEADRIDSICAADGLCLTYIAPIAAPGWDESIFTAIFPTAIVLPTTGYYDGLLQRSLVQTLARIRYKTRE